MDGLTEFLDAHADAIAGKHCDDGAEKQCNGCGHTVPMHCFDEGRDFCSWCDVGQPNHYNHDQCKAFIDLKHGHNLGIRLN